MFHRWVTRGRDTKPRLPSAQTPQSTRSEDFMVFRHLNLGPTSPRAKNQPPNPRIQAKSPDHWPPLPRPGQLRLPSKVSSQPSCSGLSQRSRLCCSQNKIQPLMPLALPPLVALKIRARALNWIQKLMGSQWSSLSSRWPSPLGR